MRLDHLLSRERSEGRDAGADFQVDRQAERPAEERKQPRGRAPRQVSGGDAAYERRTTVPLLKSVSFSMSRRDIEAAVRKRAARTLTTAQRKNERRP